MPDQTQDQIERAAHLFASFEGWRAREICDEEGIPPSVQGLGAALSAKRGDERARDRAYYGDPAYGAWPKGAK